MCSKREDLIVVIPAYEPPENFIDYVREVVKSAKAVVVVNDGSKDDFTCFCALGGEGVIDVMPDELV